MKVIAAAAASKSVLTQTESPRKDAAVQAPGCREGLSLVLRSEDSEKDTCVQCEQVNDLLCPVAEPKEEVGRQRSIRESETEINWWSYTLPSLREAQQESEEPCPSCDQAEGGDLGVGNEGGSLLGR